MVKQLRLPLPKWGGRRRGAGRPRKHPHPGLIGPGVPHMKRADFAARNPVHLTLRTLPGVGFLRGYSRLRAIEDALREARERFGLRVIHYSVQGNHLHLLVEADGVASLARGMQGLAIRLARALNRAARRRGTVFADRYHSRVLATRREVVNALRYVLQNFRHHLREDVLPAGTDPCSSAIWLRIPVSEDAPVVAPRTWLLRHAGDG